MLALPRRFPVWFAPMPAGVPRPAQPLSPSTQWSPAAAWSMAEMARAAYLIEELPGMAWLDPQTPAKILHEPTTTRPEADAHRTGMGKALHPGSLLRRAAMRRQTGEQHGTAPCATSLPFTACNTGLVVPARQLDTYLTGMGCQLIRAWLQQDIAAFVARIPPCAHSKGALILSYRGTTGSGHGYDILTALNNDLVPAHDVAGRVHRGFMQAFRLLRDAINRTLGAEERLPLYITGHSLGGALAVVAARCLPPHVTPVAVYTFGCPRVGDRAFVSGIQAPIYRVINGADPVAHIPLGDYFQTMHHQLKRLHLPDEVYAWLESRFEEYEHSGDPYLLSGDADQPPLRIVHAPASRLVMDIMSSSMANLIKTMVLHVHRPNRRPARHPEHTMDFLRVIAREHSVHQYVNKLRALTNAEPT